MGQPWTCLECSRTCDILADDYCQTCGAELPEFAEYREDGWPLCPSCGEDELWSPLLWDGNGEAPPVEAYVAAGLACHHCGWEREDVAGKPTETLSDAKKIQMLHHELERAAELLEDAMGEMPPGKVRQEMEYRWKRIVRKLRLTGRPY